MRDADTRTTLILARGADAPAISPAASPALSDAKAPRLTLWAVAGDAPPRGKHEPAVLARWNGAWSLELRQDGEAPMDILALATLDAQSLHLDLRRLPAPWTMDASFHALCIASPLVRNLDQNEAPSDGRTAHLWRSSWPVGVSTKEPARERQLMVHALGWQGRNWYDGPLVHRVRGGRIASYVPSGGAATLCLAPSLPAAFEGLSLEEALASEDTEAKQALRILRAALASRLQAEAEYQTVERETDAAERVLRLRADRQKLLDALALVMLRQAYATRRLELALPGGKQALPAPWRRLTENLGVAVVTLAEDEPPLSHFADLIPPDLGPALLTALNATTEILPRSLGQT